MWNKKRKKEKQTFNELPFSKKNVIYARLEAYAFSLILILLVFLDKDVSAIAPLINLSWAKNVGISAMYLWMAKHEHLMDKKIEYKKLGLDSEMIDEELMETESEDINIEDFE